MKYNDLSFYIPCCDASLPIVKINSYLFNKLMPDNKVFYLGFSKPEFKFYNKNHFFISLAEKQEGGAKSWTRYIHSYMTSVQDQFLVFSIDDYLLCTKPETTQINTALSLMKKNPKIGRFDLTFDCQVEGNFVNIGKINNNNIIQKKPNADYRISTQPSIWRKDFLLNFLDNDWSPWDFEILGTQMSRKENMLEQTLAFYDSKMQKYPIRTTAKGAVSRFNPGKFNVLGMPTDLIKDLVSQKFFKEEEIIWGQHANNPPNFLDKGGYDFHPLLLDYHPTSKTFFEEYFCVYDDPKQPSLTINLWDENFSHTINHPEFGYVTSQGEAAPRGKKLRYVLRQKNFNMFSGITVFTDKCLSPELIKSVDSPVKIAWIMEPPVVHPFVYERIDEIIKNVDYVFSFSKELADKYEKCYLFPWCYLRVGQEDWGIHNKSKMFSMISSKKNWAPGHQLRHEVAKKFKDRYKIDLWGKGYNEFPSLGKIKALKDYMFSIVIQNCQLDTFFTDFVDPLIAGTVPIFWGTKEVRKYFDEDGIIFFDTIEELENILSNLSEKDYYDRMNAIRNNFEKAKEYWRSDDQLADFIYKTVKRDLNE